MNTKQLAVICLIASCLLSGCESRLGVGRGGVKLTVPFDFPQDRTALDNQEKLASSIQENQINE